MKLAKAMQALVELFEYKNIDETCYNLYLFYKSYNEHIESQYHHVTKKIRKLANKGETCCYFNSLWWVVPHFIPEVQKRLKEDGFVIEIDDRSEIFDGRCDYEISWE